MGREIGLWKRGSGILFAHDRFDFTVVQFGPNEKTSSNCNDCLNVFYQKDLVKKGANDRIVHDVWVVNVVAIQK